MAKPLLRRSFFPGRGRTVLTTILAYELTALWIERSRLPTITRCVKKHPSSGVVILLALAHHFYLEPDEQEVLLLARLPETN